MKNRRVNRVFSRSRFQWEEGRYKERAKGG
jgi:hypothetical protein